MPRLAVIVGNSITGDSRVQKTALAAARDGWEVTLIGRSTSGQAERATMGPVEVLRITVGPQMRRRAKNRKKDQRGLRARITQWGLPDERSLEEYRHAYRAWLREKTAEIGWTYQQRGLTPLLTRKSTRLLLQVAKRVHRDRVRLFQWEQQRERTDRVTGDWRKDMPELLDLDLAFGRALEKLQPDVIHANDITMIGVAAHSAARMRLKGHECRWLYDAHEYVRGVDWKNPQREAAYNALEAEFIHRADAVVTVSPEIAETLRREYRLPALPLVVRNTPIRETEGLAESEASVRAACELPDSTPLLVYSGWLDVERGVDTAVEALPALPGVHLAIVSGRANQLLDELLSQAGKLGVRDRVHVVPYVPQAEVTQYLSTADVGLICSRRSPNYEMSLPTKLAEYLHAGLPVVVSDVRTASAYVTEHQVGEVFVSGDPVTFAQAVQRALDRRTELVAGISDEVLDELSWEHQSAGLLRLYRELAREEPSAPAEVVPWDAPEVRTRGEHETWAGLGETPIRLGLGPANYAGQLAAFAGALTARRQDVSAEVLMYRKPNSSFNYPADVYVNPARLGDPACQAEQIQRIIGRFTHFIADGFLPVLGRLNGDSIEGDLPALQQAGIKVALLAHGSEIRHPVRHLARHEFSLFQDAPADSVEKLARMTERNARIAVESGLPLFVTTPDLLADLPTATWAPLVVDVDAWACDRPVMERARPIVVHAPSRRWKKGTDRILPVLTDLHERGVIDFRLAEQVTWTQMRDLVHEADIVVDQFMIGSYGTFACEGMAAGKPVIAYVNDHTDVTGTARPPIVSATVATLGETLEALVADPQGTSAIGIESAKYARTYHDGTWTARALADFLT
ncbi:glycosyltransferase [Nonomuraea sp. NPDC050310]|uniref:glycosyltransferase family 4 protein n=1 Tax=Nonomuraea sp. NPDC050310 TaxID=3154935 RepID=UPI003410617F